ncbi:hypothetical protein [Actinoplanes sp. NPDC051851]|uniref:hypothetical protein n=1 Tax=Actinoplanes sp. NPDC051851 TaxID=3154753 RepID=UPI0034263AB6
MIIAVPEQRVGEFHPLNGKPYRETVTWYRYRCTVCQHSPAHALASTAPGALEQGAYHAEQAQCHAEGQLTLFPDLAAA